VSTPHQLRRPASPEAIDHAFGLFNAKAKRNVDLSQYTTYKVGGTAALHMTVASIDDLYLVSAVLAEVELPILVIGRGSNLLVSDSGFQGLALTIGGLADYVDLPNREEDPDVEPIALFGGSVALPVALPGFPFLPKLQKNYGVHDETTLKVDLQPNRSLQVPIPRWIPP